MDRVQDGGQAGQSEAPGDSAIKDQACVEIAGDASGGRYSRADNFWDWASKLGQRFLGGTRWHVAESWRLHRGDGKSMQEAWLSDQS